MNMLIGFRPFDLFSMESTEIPAARLSVQRELPELTYKMVLTSRRTSPALYARSLCDVLVLCFVVCLR